LSQIPLNPPFYPKGEMIDGEGLRRSVRIRSVGEVFVLIESPHYIKDAGTDPRSVLNPLAEQGLETEISRIQGKVERKYLRDSSSIQLEKWYKVQD